IQRQARPLSFFTHRGFYEKWRKSRMVINGIPCNLIPAQVRNFSCSVPKCKLKRALNDFFCLRHWRVLPRYMQDYVWQSRVYMYDGDIETLEAMNAICAAIAEIDRLGFNAVKGIRIW